MEHDTLVLNKETKRQYGAGLLCYNCESEYFPELGQGFVSPEQLNPNRKEFCDVSCQLAFAKVQLDEWDYPGYLEAMCEFVGYQPYVPPSFEALQRFDGTLTIEEYKGTSQPQNLDTSKRVRLTTRNNVE